MQQVLRDRTLTDVSRSIRQVYHGPPPEDNALEPSASIFTIAILTRDSVSTIERCLSSVINTDVDRIVVIDSGSADETLSAVRSFEDSRLEVVSTKWSDSFAQLRNFALEYVETGWVFFVDSDEWIDPAFEQDLRSWLLDASGVPRAECCAFAPTIREASSGAEFLTVPRLVSARHTRFRGLVHEYPIAADGSSAPLGLLGIAPTLHHSGYSAVAIHTKRKVDRNARLLALQRESTPTEGRWAYFSLRDQLPRLTVAEIMDGVSQVAKSDDPAPGDWYTPQSYSEHAYVDACVRLCELRAWTEALSLCSELETLAGGSHPDAAYFRGLQELVVEGELSRDTNLSIVRMRRNESRLEQSCLAPEGRTLDAILAAQLLRTKGREAANRYLDLSLPWTDAFFDESVMRSWQPNTPAR